MKGNVKFTKKSKFLQVLSVLLCSVLLCLGITFLSSCFFSDKNENATVVVLADNIDSGTCGTNVNWTLHNEGLLRIYGSGAMSNYSSSNTPWNSHKSDITAIQIESGVTSIGNNAFYNCINLESVTISNSVQTVGNNAFYGCTKLQEVVLSNNVTSIDAYAFQNCTSLQTVQLGANISTIGAFAFYNCSSLEQINIPDAVTQINAYTFYGCSSLKNIAIPSSVTSIGNYTFTGCTNLKIVNQATTSQTLGTDAFGSVQKIIISPNYVSNFRSNWPNYSSIIKPGDTCGTRVYWFFDENNTLTIFGSGTMTNYSYNSTNPWNDYKSSITSIEIESGVTSIGVYAFYNFTNLTSVSISSTVVTIGNAAFQNCTSLTEISIPSSVTYIGSSAFSGCTGLTEIVIPSNVNEIGSSAFSGCTNLESVTLSNRITSIEYDTFYNCTSLTEISIPNSVTYIGSYAFSGCTNLESVTLSNRITSIEYDTFYNCTSLTEISIPNSVTYIGSSAFYGCTNLESVEILGSDVRVSNQAFSGCSNLESVTSPNGIIISGNSVFSGCNKLGSITLKSGTTSIEGSTFYNCSNLQSVNIPYGVTSIGYSAFYNCSSLTNITIPDSVTNIDSNAFYGCTGLIVKIKVMNVPSGSGDYAFGSSYDNTRVQKIIVPASSVDAYKSSWPNYADIIEGIDSFFYTTITPQGYSNQTYTAAIDTDEESIMLIAYTGLDTEIVLNNTFVDIGTSLTYEDYSISFKASTSTNSGPSSVVYPSSITKFTVQGEVRFIGSFRALFGKCENVTSFDFGQANTTGVTDMSYMFSQCGRATTINVSSFDTSNVTNMEYMFSCYYTENTSNYYGLQSRLRNLDLSNFDTRKVTNMRGMFMYLGAITSLDVSSFDTSNVTNMRSMFACSIQSIQVSGSNNGYMSYTSSLQNIIFSSKFNTSKVTTMIEMFAYCGSLRSLDLSSFDSSSLSDIKNMFTCCNIRVYLSGGNISNATVNSALKNIKIGKNFTCSNITDMSQMFIGLASLESLDLSMFDTSNVTDMSQMFAYEIGGYVIGSSLKEINLSSFDTSKVTNMSGMFAGLYSLKELDISNFDTSSLENMSGMFYGCTSLKILDLSNFDLSHISSSDMTGEKNPFYNCNNLRLIYLPKVLDNEYSEAIELPGGEWVAAYDGAIGTTLGSFNMLSDNMYKRAIAKSGYDYGVEDYYMWFKDYEHVFDKENKTLTLTRYNGNDANIFIDGGLSYLGIRYKVILDVGQTGEGLFEGKTTIGSIKMRRIVYGKNISRMFYGCSNLVLLDLSGLDLTELEEAEDVFTGATYAEIMYLPCGLNAIAEAIELPNNVTYNTDNWILASDDTINGSTFGDFKDNLSSSVLKKATYIDGLDEEYRPYDIDSWYEDFVFEIDDINHYLILKKYIGEDEDLEIPANTMINGSEYTTVLAAQVFFKDAVVKSICFEEGVIATNLSNMFSLSSLESIDLRGLDTSRVTDMSYMFGYRSESKSSPLERVVLTGIDTSNVMTMEGMFLGCGKLEEIDMSGLDTSNVENMAGMFACINWEGVEQVDIEHIQERDYSKISSLKRINLTGFDTSSVRDMSMMFAYNTMLESLDLSMFDTSNIENIEGMFAFCTSLETLDLSSFDLSALTDANDQIVFYCKKLNTIYLPKVLGSEEAEEIEILILSDNDMWVLASDETVTGNTFGDFKEHLSDDRYKRAIYLQGSTNHGEDIFMWYKDFTYILDKENGTITLTRYIGSDNAITIFGSVKIANTTYQVVLDVENSGIGIFEGKDFITSVTIEKGVIALSLSRFMYGCSALEEADFAGLDTNAVRNMSAMLYGCSSLKTLDMSSFELENIENINALFNGCTALQVIYLPKAMNQRVKNVSLPTNSTYSTNTWVLRNNESITGTTFNDFVYNLSTRYVRRAIYIQGLPDNLKPYDEYLWYFEYVYEVLDLSEPPEGFEGTHFIGLYQYIGNDPDVFVPATTNINGTEYQTVLAEAVYRNNQVIETISVEEGVIATNLNEFLYNALNLKTVDLRGLDTSRVTTMKEMFAGCGKLEYVDMSGLDTSNVTNMAGMFNCFDDRLLEEIVSKYYIEGKGVDFTNPEFIEELKTVSSLKTVILTGFDTSKVTNMETMFAYCTSLETIDLSMFNTSNVENMDAMFGLCISLKTLNLSNFDTSKVNDMAGMFAYCYSLEELDISSFDMSLVSDDYIREFLGYTNLKKIITPRVAKEGISINKTLYSATNGQAYTTLPTSGSHTLSELFEITFDKQNGEENFVSMVISGSNIMSEYSKPSKLGYKLLGWFTESISGDMVVDPDGSLVLDSVDGYIENGKWNVYENKTLYAHWEIVDYTISYNLDEGEVVNPTTYNILTETFTLSNPTKAGFIFVGWTGSNGDVPQEEVKIFKGSYGNKEYTANWTTARFTLTFNTVGGIVEPESKEIVYLESYGQLPTPTKTGYSFAGWFTMAGAGEEVTEETILTEAKDKTIYAHWDVVSYEISITIEGETNVIDYTIESENITFENPSKTGYKFIGWTGTNLETPAKDLVIRTGSYGDRVYLANFEPIIYVVTLNTNGGTCGTKFIRIIYESTYKVLPLPTRKGYRFLGWYTEITGGEKVEASTVFDVPENKTIYAHWEIESFVITYDANFDDVEGIIQRVEFNSKFTTLENSTFEREGYNFVGWISRYGEYFDSNTEYTFTDDENMVLYAIWQKKGGTNTNVAIPILIGIGVGAGGVLVMYIVFRIIRKRRFNKYRNS